MFIMIVLFVMSCNSNNDFNKEKYLNEGKVIAQSTGKLLTAKVKSTIKAQGPFEAINFCKLNAYPLTDSLSNLYRAEIKRVAVKFRNPENKANKQEEAVVSEYAKQIKSGDALKSTVKNTGDVVYFYAPIKVQHACLTCHGTPGVEIPDTLYQKIKELYPNDLAVNFKEGDLRGIWSIAFAMN